MKLTPTPTQEITIDRIINEPTKSVLIGDETGFGKTLQACEAIIRAGWQRVLIISLPITHGQWAERLTEQSDGALGLRVMDGASKAGVANYEAFLRGEPGIFAASMGLLSGKDFRHQDKREKVDGKWVKVWAVDKKTDQVKLKDRKEPKEELHLVDRPENAIGPAQEPRWSWVAAKGTIGPAQEPIALRQRVHLFTFRDKMKAPLDALIFDEAHAVCSHSSIQRRTLLTLKTEHKVAMSATWSGNSFENAWSLPRWLWGEAVVPPYHEWHERWVKMQPAQKDGEDVYANGKRVMEVAGEVEPAGTFVKTLPAYIRNESGDVAPAPYVVSVEPTPEQAIQHDELRSELLTWVQNYEGETEPLVIDAPGGLYTRMREVALAELSFDQAGNVDFASDAASAKLAPLRGLLDGRYVGQQVGILTDSKKFARFVAARMNAAGYPTGLITGAQSKPERERVKEAFIAGEYRYLVGTVQSMGTGLDKLQLATSKVIWLSQPDGNPSLETQALGRFFRQGRTLEFGEFEQVVIHVEGFETDKNTMQRLVSKAFALKSSIGKEALESPSPEAA